MMPKESGVELQDEIEQAIKFIRLNDDKLSTERLQWLVSQAVNEVIGRVDKLEKLLFAIYQNDKTPAYGYGDRDENRNACGDLPPNSGSRFLTPREMIRQHFTEVKFWKLYEDYKEGLKEGK
jgi:hypothetical protein